MSEILSERDWRLFLDDMIEFCEAALNYTSGLNQEGFLGSRIVFDATVRNIELIGKAATHIPQQIRNATPRIEWRQIIATRNRLAHVYLGIDNDTLWSIIEDDIPLLLKHLRELKANSLNLI